MISIELIKPWRPSTGMSNRNSMQTKWMIWNLMQAVYYLLLLI